MRTFKKIASVTAAIIMAATVAAPITMVSFAADTNNSITVEANGKEIAFTSCSAYQIFAGDVNSSNVLTNIVWGPGVDTEKLAVALAGTDFAGKTDAADVAAMLAEKDDDGEYVYDAKVFAKAIQGALGTASKTVTAAGQGITTIDGLDDGYYIVTGEGQKNGSADGKNTVWTSGILSIVGGSVVTISPKADVASVEKKVWEDKNGQYTVTDANAATGAGWQDVADADAATDVYFKLVATLPSNLDSYSAYYANLKDTLSEGLTIDATSVKYYLVNGDRVTELTDLGDKVSVSGPTANADKSSSIDFTFPDVKKIDGVTNNSKILVVYKAELGEGFKVGGNTHNDNEVYLEYSNNPNSSYDGTGTPGDDDKGETPEDKVAVVTYEFDGTKTEKGSDPVKVLANAEFTLQNASNKYAKIDADGKIIAWVDAIVTDAEGTTTIKSDADGLFKFIGIDEGTYTLTETKAPDGYNKPSSPFTLTVTSKLADEYAAGNVVEELAAKLDAKDITATNTTGIIEGTIENAKGSSLPSTGGMGTTIFYLAGGMLVVGSGVMLITKKRMKKEAE